jgi:two-component system invasion response regulator UvrY
MIPTSPPPNPNDFHQAAATSVSVLVVDDHAIIREAVKLLLERARFSVVGLAASGSQAVSAARKLAPDVIVMDLILPELNGLDATERILRFRPDTGIVILSASCAPGHIVRAMRAGALGYVLKQSAATDVVHAVDEVKDRRRYLSPEAAEVLARVEAHVLGGSPLDRLSAREREVLHLTIAGDRIEHIAQRLSLSPKTVATYRSRIMAKLGVGDRTALIHFAMQHALAPV